MYVPDSVPESDLETMTQKGRYGAGVGFGDRAAVLVVDMTREFVEDQFPNGYAETGEPAARAIADLTDAASDVGVRSYYTRALKGDHPLERGRWDDKATAEKPHVEGMTDLTPLLSPTEEDVVFEKYKPSIFFGTQLESMLNADDVDTVIVTGMTTSGCVRATVVDAFSLNYRVVVPEECVADRSQISHELSLFDMDMKYADVLPLDEVVEELRDSA